MFLKKIGNKKEILKCILFVFICIATIWLISVKSENITPIQEKSTTVLTLDKFNTEINQTYVAQGKVVSGYGLQIKNFILNDDCAIELLLKEYDDHDLNKYVSKATVSSKDIKNRETMDYHIGNLDMQ